LKLTSEKLRMIGKTINEQFVNLKDDGSEVNVTLFKSDNLRISSTSENYTLRLVGIDDTGISSWPSWIDAETDADTSISIPHKRTAELEFLLRKSYEDYISDPSQNPEDSLITQLRIQVEVWRMGGEIMDQESQRGLIGEIMAVSRATRALVNDDAIVGWDETSRNLVDITHETEWGIEAKARSPLSESVRISSSMQLVRKDPILVLSVTEVSADNRDGMTIPEIAEEQMEEIRASVPTANTEDFRDKLDSFYRVFSMSQYFTSKWEYGETEFYEIESGSVPDLFGNGIPSGVSISGYTLNLEVLSPPTELKAILGK
jgi:hypothetical protein